MPPVHKAQRAQQCSGRISGKKKKKKRKPTPKIMSPNETSWKLHLKLEDGGRVVRLSVQVLVILWSGYFLGCLCSPIQDWRGYIYPTTVHINLKPHT